MDIATQQNSSNPPIQEPIIPSKHFQIPSFVMILIALFFIALGFYTGMNYQVWIFENGAQTSQNTQPSNQTPIKFICSQYGTFSDISQYLTKYKVKPGDSLLSIARTELDNVSQVNEIINLNKVTNPELSESNPPLEQGMTLLLPDKNWPISTGNLTEVDGQVTHIYNGGHITIVGDQSANYFVMQLFVTNDTLNSSHKQIKVNDCIKAIIETETQDIINLKAS